MLIENMFMAFHAIKANKMRAFLTMLGIIIGIGSVISIVSIGDTMRGMFSDLYKDVGITQAYVAIGYWIDDVRTSDYFTLDDLDQIEEAFGDEIAYMDSSASVSTDVQAGRMKMKFNFQGIDYTYQNVQPVEILYGRYLNEGDILGRRKNIVIEDKSAKNLFGVENAVGMTFRTTIYGDTDEYTVVGVYHKEMSPFQALLMGSNDSTGSAFLPYTLLTWPNDNFYQCHLFAADGTDMTDFMNRLTAFIAKIKNRNPEDFYTVTAVAEMGSVDQVMGALSAAVGGIAAISLLVGGIGIMNIMLVSVTERTREIGIRKALGAKESAIMRQFVIEAATTSSLGGVLGILLGYALSAAATAVIAQVLPDTPIAVNPSPAAVLIAFGVSTGIGVIFGYLPAKKAALLNPIDALRYD